jgi:hypothetical protein
MIWFAVMGLGFAACGWLCVFRTGVVVGWGRKNYERSKFVQSYPFSNVVLKPWYPIYIRCAGIFLWIWDLAAISAVLFFHFR